jgi:hypothetical protein
MSKAPKFVEAMKDSLYNLYSSHAEFVRAWCVLVELLALYVETQPVFVATMKASNSSLNYAAGRQLTVDGLLLTLTNLFVKYPLVERDSWQIGSMVEWVMSDIARSLQKEAQSRKNIKVIEDLCKSISIFAEQPDCLKSLIKRDKEKLLPVLSELNQVFPENNAITGSCQAILMKINA